MKLLKLDLKQIKILKVSIFRKITNGTTTKIA